MVYVAMYFLIIGLGVIGATYGYLFQKAQPKPR